MLKQAIVAVLLAASALTSTPTAAEEDQHLTGRDDSGAVVGADVAPGTTTTLTIVQDPSRTKTTGEGGDWGKVVPLSACELNMHEPEIEGKMQRTAGLFQGKLYGISGVPNGRKDPNRARLHG